MVKEIMYMYLGTNGTITSRVHLEDIYYIRKVCLTAEGATKRLTKDNVNFYYSITVPEDDVVNWREVDIPKGQE
jgi:hypothetical protein